MDALEKQQARLNEIILRDNFEPVAVVLEGRDTAGKSSTIRELTHYFRLRAIRSCYRPSLANRP